MRSTYLDNETEIMELYLDKDIFNFRRTFDYLLNAPENRLPSDEFSQMGVELIIRPECNQKCEYCYIARYGKELYPLNERIQPDQIVKHVDMLLDYIFNEKHVYMHHWELFAGDMFYDNLYFDVLDVFYKHLEPLYLKYPNIFDTNEGLILTPTNFSFIEDEAKAARVNEYIDKFQRINWDIGFSVSTDGKYAVDTREQRPLDDAYFDKLFQWVIDHPRNGFHPIISASNVKNSIKNYEWWRDMYAKWFGGPDNHRGFLPYWLEARNDEWDVESIRQFNKLLDFMIKDRLKMCNNDIDHLAYHLFNGDGANGTLPKPELADMLDITFPRQASERENIGCSLSSLVCFNIADLSLVPCHRTTYHQFRGGNFIVENDKITKFVAKNPAGFLNMVMAPSDSLPRCANCKYNTICHKGCLGAQFEASGEPFLPAISVCQLEMASRYCIIKTLFDMGVLDSAYRQELIPSEAWYVYTSILEDDSLGVYMEW